MVVIIIAITFLSFIKLFILIFYLFLQSLLAACLGLEWPHSCVCVHFCLCYSLGGPKFVLPTLYYAFTMTCKGFPSFWLRARV